MVHDRLSFCQVKQELSIGSLLLLLNPLLSSG